ncbi:hypothetical protein EMCRGX_G003091 [Ephydatia muelleri]
MIAPEVPQASDHTPCIAPELCLHVAFSVRQRHPQTVDEAASACTIVLESYVGQNCKPTSVGSVPMQVVEHDEAAISAVTPSDVTESSQSTDIRLQQSKTLFSSTPPRDWSRMSDRTVSLLSVGTVSMQPVVEHDEAAISVVTPSDVTESSQSTQMKQLVERLDRLEESLVRESINYTPYQALQLATGKLQSPRAKGRAQGDETVKAQEKHPIIVPTLAAMDRSVSYGLEGFLASIPLEFIIDTGAPASLLRMSTWRQAFHRDSSLVMD